MSNMVVPANNKALLGQKFHKTVVPADVFAHTMDYLYNANGFPKGNIQGSVYLADSIGAAEPYFR